MSSLLDVRLGAQEPVILHLPPDVHSLAAAEEAIELADAYGICDGNPLAESQKITLRAACGERADGSWAASRVGDFGPRQGTGKNDKIAARELAGLILFGEPLIIHTAHEFPTANESFLRLVAVFENWDDLRKRVARILYGNGTQSINLLSGQRILYKARTGGAGRGFSKAALIVYDEAQHLARSHVAASGPAKLANPNSQTWLAGSGGFSTSEVAWEMRRQAILGMGGRLAYTEMTAQSVEVRDGRIFTAAPDPLDRDGWYACMPGLGRWVTEEAMAALYDDLGPVDFAREGECVWDPEPGGADAALPGWAACRDDTSTPGTALAFAVDVAPDRAFTSFAVASDTDGKAHVEVVDHRPGTEWLVSRAKELQARWGGDLWIAKGSPAWALEEDLNRADIRLRAVTIPEHAQACGVLYDRVEQGHVRHLGQPPLDTAVACAHHRALGDAWLWSRRTSTGDISPLVAVTLALWGAVQAANYDILDSVW